jgi:hypothetical protein
MNIKRTVASIATAAVIACAGMSSQAVAFTPVGGLSNGPAHPTVKWDYNAWKHCFWITYGQWREGGASPANSQTAAELTCGTQP